MGWYYSASKSAFFINQNNVDIGVSHSSWNRSPNKDTDGLIVAAHVGPDDDTKIDQYVNIWTWVM